LNSVYKRKKSFKDNFGVSSPIKVVLEKTFTGNNGINLKEKSTFGYFVPFQSSLEKLLSIIPSTETLEFDSDQNQNKSNIYSMVNILNQS
jgi:galactitol-specific phosphotransferase system IIC component